MNSQGAGVFVVVNAGGRRGDSINRVRALFADFDEADEAREFGHLALAPSIIVESSPGKHHAYWLSDPDDPLPLGEFTAAQKAIAATLGADPKVCDLPRVMRLPGYWHRKGDAHLVRIISSTGRRYSADVLRDWLAALAPAATVAPSASCQLQPTSGS